MTAAEYFIAAAAAGLALWVIARGLAHVLGLFFDWAFDVEEDCRP